jgi:membrane associated rhomboid family serine protease
MGVYDRDYYRSDRSGPWFGFSGSGQVVKWLIVVNVGMFIAQSMTIAPGPSPGPITEWLDLDVGKVLHGQIWRLVTYAFLHANFNHILWNMLFLFWFGRDVEEIYGSREFLAFYLTSALAGGVGFVICNRLGVGSDICLGASGAVMACLVLCALHDPRRIILLFFVLPIPIWFFVLFMLIPDAYALLMALRYSGQFEGAFGTSTAVAAHVCGALFAYGYFRGGWRIMRTLDQFRAWHKRATGPRLRVYREEPVSAPTFSSRSPAAEGDEQMEAKVDAVLEKVARLGQDSLTETEKQILLRASEVYRRRRT